MTDAVHVIPTNDLVAHEADEDCVCLPTAQPVERADGSIGWVLTHHALDGRKDESTRPTTEGNL
jgi:hypothetical protein